MNIGAELGQYILLTHNLKNYEDSMGVLKPHNLPRSWVRQ